MTYLLLIVEPPGQREERGREAGEAVYRQMQAFAATLQSRGVLQGVNSLAAAGTRLQVRGGRRHIVDGPFAEAKELVGGYFLVDVPTRDEAISLAAECPAAAWATVEVREVGPCFL